MREIADLVAFCCLYEFEDVISEIDAVDIFKPASYDDIQFSRKIYKLAKYLTKSSRIANFIVPIKKPVILQKDYQLFFPIFNSPFELFALPYLQNWRNKSQKAVCYIAEVWQENIPTCKYLLELLKDFDHIFLSVSNMTEEIAKITGRPCTYLPPGVDALKFSPYPLNPHRSIDVCSLGRRSSITHKALLDIAQQRKFFYYHDTVKIKDPQMKNNDKHQTFRVNNPQEHRNVLANIIKRSRYFIANRANANEPYLTKGKEEIGYRFFEGAAAGSIMIGDPPKTEKFQQYFDWEDSVIEIPFDAPNIGDIIAELDAQPKRLERIRRDNVMNSLLRHDWVHRLRTVFEAVDLKPTENMLLREAKLKALANKIQQTSDIALVS